jgi:hypothetical protein
MGGYDRSQKPLHIGHGRQRSRRITGQSQVETVLATWELG